MVLFLDKALQRAKVYLCLLVTKLWYQLLLLQQEKTTCCNCYPPLQLEELLYPEAFQFSKVRNRPIQKVAFGHPLHSNLCIHSSNFQKNWTPLPRLDSLYTSHQVTFVKFQNEQRPCLILLQSYACWKKKNTIKTNNRI